MKKLCLALLAVVLTSTAAGGCGSDGGAAPKSLRESIKVTGDFGVKPTISIDTPLKFSETADWSLSSGDGDKVGAQATAILQLTLADGRTGKTAISTLDTGQRPLEAPLAQVFPSLAQALTGKQPGSRVIVASTAEDSYGDRGAPQIGVKAGDPVVMVADVLSTDPTSVLPAPTGTPVAPPANAPRLVEQNGTPTGFDFAKLKKPKKLVVVPLREGTGPAVENPDRVTVNYLGSVWGSQKVFDESYTKEPTSFSVGLGSVIPAWDKGLQGVKEGSRVMLICPPDLAYGKAGQPPSIPGGSTLVFVIDVLGVG